MQHSHAQEYEVLTFTDIDIELWDALLSYILVDHVG